MSIPVWRKEKWKEMNLNESLPVENSKNQLLVVGCNYHTTWQSVKSMRFVLTCIKGNKAKLETRTTGKSFWTNLDDLLFIDSNTNMNKAIELRPSVEYYIKQIRKSNYEKKVKL